MIEVKFIETNFVNHLVQVKLADCRMRTKCNFSFSFVTVYNLVWSVYSWHLKFILSEKFCLKSFRRMERLLKFVSPNGHFTEVELFSWVFTFLQTLAASANKLSCSWGFKKIFIAFYRIWIIIFFFQLSDIYLILWDFCILTNLSRYVLTIFFK